MSGELHVGDVRDGLRSFIERGLRARTCVTSPPYWGLRDYGVDGQIGLESWPDEFITTMVDVFRLVRDVLADDGTLWLNMGDAYAGGRKGGNPPDSPHRKQATNRGSLLHAGYHEGARQAGVVDRSWQKPPAGYKAKDLMGMPWRLAFALQADGWWLRQDIIWSKPNPMPESIRDRCTKAHEYLFLLAKRERYYFDQDAILEPVSASTHARLSQNVQAQIGSERANGGAKTNGNMKAVARKAGGTPRNDGDRWNENAGRGFAPRTKDNDNFDSAMAIMPHERNKRSVWSIPTESFKEAHFATFPQALVEPCIAAGSEPGDYVLDPFMGSGTTAMVAQRLGRKWLGTELNPAYAEMIRKRTAQLGMELIA